MMFTIDLLFAFYAGVLFCASALLFMDWNYGEPNKSLGGNKRNES